MATERMRLEAEMRDSASPVIKKLREELVALQDATREGRAVAKLNKEMETLRKEAGAIRVTPGMVELPKWLGKATTGAQDFVKTGGGAAGVIGAMGIGGLTAAASLSGLTALMKEMGERALGMKELGREVGMTVDEVNSFAHAGAHFGVGADAMKSALNHLSGQMPEFRRNYGTLFQELSRWPDLIKKLQQDSSEDQIKDIFKFLGSEKLQNEPQLQKQILGSIFGNGDEMEKLFAQGAQGFLSELEKQKRQLGPISPEMMKQAQDFRDAQIHFNDALEKFETTVGPAFLGMMTKIVDKAAEFFAPDRKKIEKRQHDGGAADERAHDGGTGWMDDPRIKDALRKKSSFRGGGGLLSLTSFEDGSSPAGSGSGDPIAVGTKAGVLAAFREMMATQEVGQGGAGGGFINATYGQDGPGGSRRLGAGTSGHDLEGNYPESSGAGNLTKLIDAAAKKAGIDPRIMEGIRAGESLHSNRYDKKDDAIESSWGPFQLNRRRGLGVQFERDTHLDLRDPKSIPAQAAWVAKYLAHGGSLRAWSGYHGPRNADPRWGDSGYIPDVKSGMAALGARNGAGAKAVDIAQSLLGQGEGGAARALGHYMSSGQWCSDFVNGALEKSGGKGTGSAWAPSFKKWGHHVGAGDIRKGDILVSGHHVGFASGPAQMHNGRMMYPMISGNWGHRVAKGWASPGEYEARRANGLSDPAIAGASPGGKHHLDVHIHDRGSNVRSATLRPGGSGTGTIHHTRWPTNRETDIQT